MRYIEPHLHGELASTSSVEGMAMGGIEAAVLLSTYKGVGKSSRDLLGYYKHILTYYKALLDEFDIQPFFGLGVPVTGTTEEEAEEIYPTLREYLEKPEVVAVGEIGIESEREYESTKFKTQLEIAEEKDVSVVCHSPVPRAEHKPEIVRKILSIIKEERFDPEKIVIDHTNQEMIKEILNAGAWAGISICADKLTPREAAKLSKEHQNQQILVDSEYGWNHEGYFSVTRTGLEMKMLGMERKEIEKILYKNPTQFYNLKNLLNF